MTGERWWEIPGHSSVEECQQAAAKLAAGEDEVENDRGHVDWERTYDRLESWYHLRLPTDTDDERYKVMKREIQKARRGSG